MAKRTGAGNGKPKTAGDKARVASGKPRAASGRAKKKSAARRVMGNLFPEVAWLYWLVPRRGRPLFKTKLAIVLLATAVLGRLAYVHVRHSLAVADLRAAGYVLDGEYSIEHSRRWINPEEPDDAPVTFYRYPRPDSSPFEKAADSMRQAWLDRSDGWRGKAIRWARVSFMYATDPFLMPLDSRSGFDPYAEPSEEEATEDQLKKFLKQRKNEGSAAESSPGISPHRRTRRASAANVAPAVSR